MTPVEVFITSAITRVISTEEFRYEPDSPEVDVIAEFCIQYITRLDTGCQLPTFSEVCSMGELELIATKIAIEWTQITSMIKATDLQNNYNSCLAIVGRETEAMNKAFDQLNAELELLEIE